MSEVKHIMFDFDGTLADTSEGIINSMHYAYDALDLEREENETIRNIIGPPLEQMFEQLLNTSDQLYINKAVGLFRERYAVKGVNELSIYNGVAETLKKLYESGFKLYIVTSKPEKFVIEICKKNHIYEYFTDITGVKTEGNSLSKSSRMKLLMEKHGLTSENSIMVGDRPEDVNAASSNNIVCIGVTYGFGKETDLRKSGCTKIIDDFSEITNCL